MELGTNSAPTTLHNNNNNNNNNNALGIETTDKWYTHVPKPMYKYEEGDVTVLWNQEVHTDREVTANRPDIIIKNKKHNKFSQRLYCRRCRITYISNRVLKL